MSLSLNFQQWLYIQFFVPEDCHDAVVLHHHRRHFVLLGYGCHHGYCSLLDDFHLYLLYCHGDLEQVQLELWNLKDIVNDWEMLVQGYFKYVQCLKAMYVHFLNISNFYFT